MAAYAPMPRGNQGESHVTDPQHPDPVALASSHLPHSGIVLLAARMSFIFIISD
jgi:hypothetical protein